MGSNQDGKEKTGRIELDWDDPIACQLGDLLLDNLDLVFESAVKEISEYGYDEQVAVKAVTRRGLYVDDGGDPIQRIIDDALARLKGTKDASNIMTDKFDDLQHMTGYTLLEMVGVLREVRPFLSDGEAMWWLLLCDLNVLQACRMEEDSSGGILGCKDSLQDISFGSVLSQLRSEARNCLSETLKLENVRKHSRPKSPHVPEETSKEETTVTSMLDRLETCLAAIGVNMQMRSEASASEEEKSGVDGQVPNKRQITALLQKQLNLGRTHWGHGSNGPFKSGRLGNYSCMSNDKKPKYIPEIPGLTTKYGSSYSNAELGGRAPLACNKHNASVKKPSTSRKAGNSSRLARKGTLSSMTFVPSKLIEEYLLGEKSYSNSAVNTSGSPTNPDYCVDIPYDKSLGKYLPRDEKDEIILKLVPRLQELQYEIHCWTEWANYKIKQATCRLTKDQLVLRRLRQDPEEDRQSQWEIVAKKLPGIENGLNDIIALVEKTKIDISGLEKDKSLLKKDAEAARLEALESTANYQVALEREQNALKEVRSWEVKNDLLHKEIEMEKKKVASLHQDLDKAKNTHQQVEARCEQERMEKERLVALAASVRKEREQQEILVKEEEDSIKQKAEADKRKNMEDVVKLENKFLRTALKFDASRRAALKEGSFANHLTEAKSLKKGDQNSTSFKKMMNLGNPFQYGGSRQERECVMCLSEEFSVVFVPCSHQVLCEKCNALHEERGMKDCPSCRTPILRRINARFVKP